MGWFARRIQRTCLNPLFSLRMQMFLSFGTTAVIAIGSFIMVGLFTIANNGSSVRNEASVVLEQSIQYSLGRSAEYAAEAIAKKFDYFGSTYHGNESWLESSIP
jgi:hypothetical protein